MSAATRPILFRNARVVDGTGAPWFRADVRIEAERIAAVAPGLPAGDAEIVDVADRWLSPGFIEIGRAHV
jgi:N-acyl-D-amino-acid deacylase